jgi:hypothetical protein
MGWKGDSPVLKVSENRPTIHITNDNMDIYVQHNARDHEVFVTDHENSIEGVSIFTAQACRDVADSLNRAADWLDIMDGKPEDK